MEKLHSLLQRQLKRYFGQPFQPPEAWHEFLSAISDVYHDSDVQHELLERSLVLGSRELHQANAEMQAIFQAIPDLLLRLDCHGTILEVKAGASGEFWQPAHELVGRQIPDLPSGEIGAQFADAIRRVMAGESPITVRYSLTLEVREQAYEARLVPLAKDQIMVIIQNVTERKRVEEELFKSHQMLQTVMDTIPQRVFWKDRNSVYVGCNKPLAEDCGYKDPAEIIGKTDFETISAPLANVYRADDRQVMESGQAKFNYEEPMISADGRKKWLRTSKAPLYDKQGLVIGVLGTYEDITERKTADEELRRREERFRSLIENASDIITVLNHQGIIHFQSPSSERVLGYSPAEMTGRNTFDFTHPDDLARVKDALGQTANSSAPVAFEHRFKHRDGTWRTIASVSRNVPDETADGHIIVNSRDITENVKLEEKFRQAQKMEAIGQLSGGIAHDFNNLLTVILGNVSLMELDKTLAQELRDSATEIKRAAERAAKLTRQLLAYSRRQAMHPAALDLNEAVSNMTQMLQRILGEDIIMHIRCAPQPAPIWADVSMIEQILLNLAVNSRDAMPKGGRLVIETANVEIDERTVTHSSHCQSGPFVCLSLSDTGCGIDAEILPKIFEPFFTTKDIGKGTGLGLATVYGIVQQHHGWIDVQSEIGKGTTFRVYLPRLDKPAAVDSIPPTLSSAQGGSETILVVEDETALRLLVKRVLAGLGYHVLVASTGAAALEVWQEKRNEIHLLLTDLLMPGGMTGRELAQRLSQDKPDLKIIYSSGYSPEINGKDLALKEGVNFLPKPFNPATLAAIVRTRLNAQMN